MINSSQINIQDRNKGIYINPLLNNINPLNFNNINNPN